MKRFLLLGVVLLVLGSAAIGIAIWHATSPTNGARIAGARHGKALIVIDLQEDYTGPHAKQPYAEPAKLVAAANQLVDAASAGGWPVFLVRVTMPDDWVHGLMTGFTAIAGTPGANFDARLDRPTGAIEITKTYSDAFSNPLLDRELAAKNVGQLYVAGLDARFCVKQTIGGALNRGYTVNAVGDAIATRHGTPLAELLDGYRAKGAVVKTLAEAVRELTPAQPPPGAQALPAITGATSP
jgi:nicotinamidase-related amidase